MHKELNAALTAYAPVIAARYAAMVEREFANLIKIFGVSMNGIANSKSYKFWNETIRPITKMESAVVNGRRQAPVYSIDADRLAACAEAYAALAVESFLGKIESKMGELDSAEVKYLSGSRFDIVGTKAGRKVRIEQDMIINQSSKGTLFNQFPARIYVDGKFISEAKFKAAFAA